MEDAATHQNPDKGSGADGVADQTLAVDHLTGATHAADAPEALGTQLPTWSRVLGWCGVVGLIYLLICAVSIISRGFAGLGGDAAHSMFELPLTLGSDCS